MKPAPSKTIYEQLVAVAYEYFGPAAERFILRTIETHLGKKPDELTKDDIPQLLVWGKLAIGLVAEDPRVVNSFSRDVMCLVEEC